MGNEVISASFEVAALSCAPFITKSWIGKKCTDQIALILKFLNWCLYIYHHWPPVKQLYLAITRVTVSTASSSYHHLILWLYCWSDCLPMLHAGECLPPNHQTERQVIWLNRALRRIWWMVGQSWFLWSISELQFSKILRCKTNFLLYRISYIVWLKSSTRFNRLTH
jgi:hypothetical protein